MSFSIQAVKYGLDKLFPKENYKKDIKLTLHYLICYKNNKGAIQWLGKYPEYAGATESNSLLTPLHLCAITSNKVIAEKLIHLPKVSITAQDVQKWTPLHHAALHANSEMLDLLLTLGKTYNYTAPFLKNINNGTYEDLRRLAFPENNSITPDLSNSPNPVVFSYLQDDLLLDGTIDDYQKMTRAKFTAKMHASPIFFIEEWAVPTTITKSDISLSNSLITEYNSYCNNPPKLYLSKTSVGNGVFAAEDIPQNTILTEYLGEATHAVEESAYLIRLCNGERVCNFGPMINEGFPNCVDCSICHIEGFPIINVLRSVRTIKKGEQILFHYGCKHPVKLGKYCNLGIDDCEQYFREKDIIERMKDLNNAVKSGNWLEYRSLLTPVHYLLATSSVQVLLLLKKIIIKKQLAFVMDIFKKNDGSYFISSAIEKNCTIVENLFKINTDGEQGETLLASIIAELFLEFKMPTVIQLLTTMTNSNPETIAFTQEIIKKNIQPNLLIKTARQLEEALELREQFEDKEVYDETAQKLANAIMDLTGPLAKNITCELIIWPLLALAKKNEAFAERYLFLLACHELKEHLNSLSIFHGLAS